MSRPTAIPGKNDLRLREHAGGGSERGEGRSESRGVKTYFVETAGIIGLWRLIRPIP